MLKMRYQGESNMLTIIFFPFFSLKGGGVVLRIKYTVLEKENKTQT